MLREIFIGFIIGRFIFPWVIKIFIGIGMTIYVIHMVCNETPDPKLWTHAPDGRYLLSDKETNVRGVPGRHKLVAAPAVPVVVEAVEHCDDDEPQVEASPPIRAPAPTGTPSLDRAKLPPIKFEMPAAIKNLLSEVDQ